MEHTKHIWRALFILVFVAVCGVLARHFLVPKSFGLAGPYRYDALADLMGKPVVHGSLTACQSCHTVVWDALASGKHAPVRCEVCHAPVTTHAKEGQKTADMVSNTSVKLCAYCHQKLRARPEDMPQIDIMEHLAKLEVAPADGQLQDGLCIACHDVHSPSLK
jgi:hypothetical protein